MNPDNGETVWSTRVGPGGELGGLQWGSAVDGDRVYVAVSNSNFVPHALARGGEVKGGTGLRRPAVDTVRNPRLATLVRGTFPSHPRNAKKRTNTDNPEYGDEVEREYA